MQFKKAHLKSIPDEWTRVLQAAQDFGAEEAVINGGALRDSFNNRPVKDIDIFLKCRGSESDNRAFLENVFAAAGVTLKEKLSDIKAHASAPPDDPANAKTWLSLEAWDISAANGTLYNFVFVKNRPLPKNEFINLIMTRPPFSLSQIVYAGGDKIMMTRGYKKDVKRKTIRAVNSHASKSYLDRMMKKYPDWNLCDKSKKILRDFKESAVNKPHETPVIKGPAGPKT